MKTLTLFLLMFLISCNKDTLKDINPMEKVVESISDATTEAPLLPEGPTWNDEYIELVNTHRRDLGLRALQVSPYIDLAALDHSQKMADKTIPFGHTGSATRCSLIINAIGSGNLCGEIVASGYKTPQSVFEGWIKSPTHKSKIENTRYTHTGLGFAKNSTGVIYWTQIFLEVN